MTEFTGTSSNTGTSYDLDALDLPLEAPSEPNARIEGGAGALDAWLWGRGDLSALEVIGDQAIPARIPAQAVESTQ